MMFFDKGRRFKTALFVVLFYVIIEISKDKYNYRLTELKLRVNIIKNALSVEISTFRGLSNPC